MRTVLSGFVLVLLWACSQPVMYAQSVLDLSASIHDKISTLRSGELEYSCRFKNMFSYDTITWRISLRFFRTDNDPNYTIILEKKGVSYNIFDRHWLYVVFPDSGKGWVKNMDAKDFIKSKSLYDPIFSPRFRLNLMQYDITKKYTLQDSSLNSLPIKVIRSNERFKISDSLYNGTELVYYINSGDSIPVYSKEVHEDFGDAQFYEYTLLRYQINNYDSTAFFSMLKDSIASVYRQYKMSQVEPATGTTYNPAPEILTIAPDFTGISLDSTLITLYERLNNNKVVILDFWYNSCMPCRMSSPILASLYKKYKDKGVEVIGINPIDTNKASIRKTLNRYSIQYPVVVDRQKRITSTYNVAGFPTIFALNRKKEIIFNQEGYSDDLEEKMTNRIEKELSK